MKILQLIDNKKFLLVYMLNKFGIGITAGIQVALIIKFGYTLNDICLMFAGFGIATFIAEIPTGAFADVYGHKKSSIIGSLLLSISLAAISLGQNVHHYFFANLIGGLGNSMISGSYLSWYISNTKKNGDQISSGYYGNISKYQYIGILAGTLTGSFASDIFIRLPWIIGSLSLFFSAVIMFKIPEYEKKQRMKFRSIFEYTTPCVEKVISSFKQIKNNNTLKLLLVIKGFNSIAIVSFLLIYQPFFQIQTGNFTYTLLGLLSATRLLFSIFTSNRISWISKKVSCNFTLLLMAIFADIVFRGTTNAVNNSIRQKILNDNIKDEDRATLLSINSLTNSFFEGVIYLLLTNITIVENNFYTLLFAVIISLKFVVMSMYFVLKLRSLKTESGMLFGREV